MSGVNGAVKLNNLTAPSSITETELSVSAFGLQAEEKLAEQTVEEIIEEPTQEIVIETPKQVDNQSIVEVVEQNVVERTPKIVNDFNVKAEFDKVVAVIKLAYDKVFSKSPNFKPEFGETVGDLIFYISSKLRKINANNEFDKAFNLSNYFVLSKYDDLYIPLALKLAVWCESKNLLKICEELLFEISSLYKNCAENSGIILLEGDVANAFIRESALIFNK